MVEKANFCLALIAVVIILFFIPLIAYGEQDTWTGDSSDSWNEPGNWQSGKVPDSTDSVTIPSKLKTYPDISGNAYCMRLRVLGTCKMKSSATINITAGGELIVEAGATFQATGDTSGYATVTRYGASGFYEFEVKSSGTIGANTTIFEYMDTNGVELESGAKIDTMLAFKNCIFRHGEKDGVLFTVNADLSGASDTLIIEDCRFDSLCSESLSNNVYRDSSSTGSIYFVSDSGGNFWGEDYDDDEGDLVVWNLKPVAVISWPEDGTELLTGTFAFFYGNSSYDQDGDSLISYYWDFGDTTNSNYCNTYHNYSDTGEIEVSLEVTDISGSKSKISICVYLHTYPSSQIKISDLDFDGNYEILLLNQDAYLWKDVIEIYEPGYSLSRPVCCAYLDTLGMSTLGWPATADLDLDDTLEIIVPSFNGLYAFDFHHNGGVFSLTEIWHIDDTITGHLQSAPIIVDLDFYRGGDRTPEIIVTSSFGATYEIMIFDANGQPSPDFQRNLSGVAWPNPAIGDFDQDGIPEIVYGTRCQWTRPDGTGVGARLYILNDSLRITHERNIDPYSCYGQQSPTIGDINYINNRNGNLEILLQLGISPILSYGVDTNKVEAFNITDSGFTSLWYRYLDDIAVTQQILNPSLARDITIEDSSYYDVYPFVYDFSPSGDCFRLNPHNGIAICSANVNNNITTQGCIGNFDSDSALEICFGINDTGLSIYKFDLTEKYYYSKPYKVDVTVPCFADWNGDDTVDVHFIFDTPDYYDTISIWNMSYKQSFSQIEWQQVCNNERNTSLYAQTYGGILTNNAVWWGNYIIYKDIKIAQGCTLYIEPGTNVWILPDSLNNKEIGVLSGNLGDNPFLIDFVIEGKIKVCGKENSKVKFVSLTPSPTNCDWGGIQFDGSGDKGFIEHALVENARIGIKISLQDFTLKIKSTEIKNCKIAGIYTAHAQPFSPESLQVKNCVIHNICTSPPFWSDLAYGIWITDSTFGMVIDSTEIYNVRTGLRTDYSESIFVENCYIHCANPGSLNNTIGIYVHNYSKACTLKANKIIRNNNNIHIAYSDDIHIVGEIAGPTTIGSWLDTTKYSISSYKSLAYIKHVNFGKPDTFDYYCGINSKGDSTDTIFIGALTDPGVCNFYTDHSDTTNPRYHIWLEGCQTLVAESIYIDSCMNDLRFRNDDTTCGDTSYSWHSEWPLDPPLSPKLIIRNKVSLIKPTSFFVDNNYPNPFNSNTEIKFCLNKDSHINISIYNILGDKVKTLVDENLSEGMYTVFWNGKDYVGTKCPSGVSCGVKFSHSCGVNFSHFR